MKDIFPSTTHLLERKMEMGKSFYGLGAEELKSRNCLGFTLISYSIIFELNPNYLILVANIHEIDWHQKSLKIPSVVLYALMHIDSLILFFGML